MSRTASPSSGRPYGVATVCRTWRVARATLYRHRAPARPAPPRRPGPAGPMPDADLVEEIRRVLRDSPFHGEGHRKVWARLRIAGIRTSKRRVLRLMRENGIVNLSDHGTCLIAPQHGAVVHAAIWTHVSSRQTRKALARARRYWAAVIRCRRGRKWP